MSKSVSISKLLHDTEDINNKIEKFEITLSKELDKLYKSLEAAKKEYESHLENFGFTDCTSRDIAKIQIIGAKIEALENIIDEFGCIFERGE